MKKKILIGVGVALLLFVLYGVYVIMFPASPPKAAAISEQGLDISVKYGGPFKKGRLIFGEAKDKPCPNGDHVVGVGAGVKFIKATDDFDVQIIHVKSSNRWLPQVAFTPFAFCPHCGSKLSSLHER